MKIPLLGTSFLAATVLGAQAATFIPITDVSTNAVDFYAATNMIQGAGVGFDATAPHDALGSGGGFTWVTDDPGGFPSDYIAVAGMPVITLDLGTNALLGEISVWGYAASNSNGVSQFSLRFATEADGAGGFGTSISYNPTYGDSPLGANPLVVDHVPRQSFLFTENVTARYVEFTLEDNWFVAPGDGSGGELAGGDRVGVGEIAFEANVIVPEPSAGLLGLLGALLVLRRRR